MRAALLLAAIGTGALLATGCATDPRPDPSLLRTEADNFRAAFDSGMKMAANLVFIPGLVGLDEMEGVVSFLAGLDRNIPFHIDGYIPIPGLPWKRPTDGEMEAQTQRAYLILRIWPEGLYPDVLAALREDAAPAWIEGVPHRLQVYADHLP